MLNRALTITAAIDLELGMLENAKKRQIWAHDETTEHLGIRACPNTAILFPAVPPPRTPWDDLVQITRRVTAIPGPAQHRETIIQVAVASKYRWAAPFVEVPPDALVEATRQAVQRTRCTWWSSARFWADRIDLHPQLGTAIRSLKAAASIGTFHSPLLYSCLRHHARALGLRFAEDMPTSTGIWVRLAPDTADPRCTAVLSEALTPTPDGHEAFDASDSRGQHLVRCIARIRLLQHTVRSDRRRMDEEGITDIDVEARSTREWKAFVASIGVEARTSLQVIRGGAIWTPTRRYSQFGRDSRRRSGDTSCPWCEHPYASAHHFFTTCPHFEEYRQDLQEAHDIPPEWWARQPRVTTKTAWVTTQASDDPRRRAEMGVAAARLLLQVTRELKPFADLSSEVKRRATRPSRADG